MFARHRTSTTHCSNRVVAKDHEEAADQNKAQENARLIYKAATVHYTSARIGTTGLPIQSNPRTWIIVG
jgi:hypothetical protein